MCIFARYILFTEEGRKGRGGLKFHVKNRIIDWESLYYNILKAPEL